MLRSADAELHWEREREREREHWDLDKEIRGDSIDSQASFHPGIPKIYNLYEGNLEPFQLWLETLDKPGTLALIRSGWP